MGTLQRWRKAYGALKDHTEVGLAPCQFRFEEIMVATSAVWPRVDVAYCIHALSRRLAKTHDWTAALKTLVVTHRMLRQGDPIFKDELLNFQERGHVLQMSNFKDDSSVIAWDFSARIRTYGLFLEERLECFRILRCDIEAERLPRPAQGKDKFFLMPRHDMICSSGAYH